MDRHTFYQALQEESPLQIIGTPNAYIALLAKKSGYKAIYLSGASIANSCYALPDIGLNSLDMVLEEARRITDTVDTPLLVDIDTGFGNNRTVARAIKLLEKASVAAIHMEDQIFEEKKCGHLEKKRIISQATMCDKIRAAVDARSDERFFIIARCDAYHNEGFDGLMERLHSYKEAGADAVFPEALASLEEYTQVKALIGLPVLANITEFGKTPLFTIDELKKSHVDMALYPLSIARAMNLTALKVLNEIKQDGTQIKLIDQMQTRDELYHFLDYNPYE